jgi:hypothetical protein
MDEVIVQKCVDEHD